MTAAEIARKMVSYSNGNRHDINHFMKVYAFAKTIGECEGLDRPTQTILEIAAIVHDIACPLCREKYGSTGGRLQEQESAALVETFLGGLSVTEESVKRVAWVAAHHHTLPDRIEPSEQGMDHQILLEADFLVNADEGKMSEEAVRQALTRLFRTKSGRSLLCSAYQL